MRKNGKKSAKNAQIVLCVGNDSDAWAEKLNATVVRATDGLMLMDTDGNPATDETSAKKLDTDVLTVPVNNMLCASSLADALSAMDAEHAQQYQDNASAYVEALIDLDLRFREAVQGIEAITCKDGSMRYFAQEYGVVYEAKAGAGVVVLSTYNDPGKADMEMTYIQLMERNLEALNAAK